MLESQDILRIDIAQKVRELRRARRLTQAELARRLGLSQSRLSEIERGDGSFTAEQLLLILGLFNVGLDAFAPPADERAAELQNALARLGATHLHEDPHVVPNERLDVANAISEALAHAESPRLVTALAPVLVCNMDRIRLPAIGVQLAELGLGRRWGWLLENTLEAVRTELASTLPRAWARRCRRADVVLQLYLQSAMGQPGERGQGALPLDLFDSNIRSQRTVDEIVASSSGISRRWAIVTTLQPNDFAAALRAARVSD